MTNAFSDVMFGAKGPKSAFKKGDLIGLEVGGIVLGTPEVRQSTDLDSGEPAVWPDGKPKMEIIVTVQTALKDDAEDDGKRRFFLKQSSDILRAVRAALEKTGVTEIEEGGYLAIKFTSEGTAAKPHWSAPRKHSAVYQKPKVSAQSQVMGTATAAQPVQQPYQANDAAMAAIQELAAQSQQ